MKDKKILGKILLGGIIYAVIAQIIHTIESMLTMEYYMKPELMSLWSKLMMPSAGPPPPIFFMYSILFSLIIGMLFCLVYYVIQKAVPGKGYQKGLTYGSLVFLIGIFPGTLTFILLLNIPLALIVAWSISAYLIAIINSCIAVKLIK